MDLCFLTGLWNRPLEHCVIRKWVYNKQMDYKLVLDMEMLFASKLLFSIQSIHEMKGN